MTALLLLFLTVSLGVPQRRIPKVPRRPLSEGLDHGFLPVAGILARACGGTHPLLQAELVNGKGPFEVLSLAPLIANVTASSPFLNV